jgi:hypothetical protein
MLCVGFVLQIWKHNSVGEFFILFGSLENFEIDIGRAE